MPLVPAKCPNCGGDINIDSESRTGICEFCKNPFMAEDAINTYNTYNQNSYNIANAEVHIHDEKSIEQKLDAAEIFFSKHHDLAEARRLFREVSQEAPGNYKAWWGLVRIDTDDFHNTSIELQQQENAYLCAKRACAVADSEALIQIKTEWNSYVEVTNQKIKTDIDFYQNQNQNLIRSIEMLQQQEQNNTNKKTGINRYIYSRHIYIQEQENVLKNLRNGKKYTSNLNTAAIAGGSVGMVLSLLECLTFVVRGKFSSLFVCAIILLGVSVAIGILNRVVAYRHENRIKNIETEIEIAKNKIEIAKNESNAIYNISSRLTEQKNAIAANNIKMKTKESQLSSWDII